MPTSKNHGPEQALAIITQAAEEIAQSLGFQLVDAHFGQQGRKTSLEITIYKPGGRIGLADCEKVSRELESKLESLTELPALLHGSYVLDVCSPGIERVLKHEREYKIFAGSQVELKAKADVGAGGFGQHFLATLVGLDGDKVKLAALKELPRGNDKGSAGKKGSGKNKKDKIEIEPVHELSVPLKQITALKLYADLSKAAHDNQECEALEAEASLES
ncbi:MAG TPA: hypothetical protein PKN86_04590 [Candidatus Obscuribacter sp.]|nr:hypothetical protein [Candidatus Obscuribacter sp.]MBK9279318.1 hypothetical protein [Candidatus Obscuribacter sp.]MBL8083075.1 hypothetical protein [Candidatus Obscuribacter sp.]HMW91904.1 hypothetical protein [Candidatus Obscuribacter sp.]HMY02391.1 hypothetical protein [Candidatus Obscuribacter sp.]